MTSSANPPLRSDEASGDRRLAGLLGLALFVVYALGACPTVYVGDSGELTTAVHLLGIPHPSGYPLYAMLGKLWTLLVPFGSIAYRMSLFSAACAAAACAGLFLLCRRAGTGRFPAVVGALLLAFAPSFWAEANIQRVYALNALFVVVVTSLVFRWHRERNERTLILAFFLTGLGACNHTYMLVYGFGLGLFVLAADLGFLTQPWRGARLAAAAIAGLLPYAYLPIRSLANPRLDWGNPETLDNFLGVVLRRDFWERKWIEGPADLLTIAADYLGGIGRETLWAGAALAVVGLVAGRKRWPVLLPLLAMGGNYLSMALHGSRSDLFIWHRYYIPSYAMTALLAGFGLHLLLASLPRHRFTLRVAAVAVPVLLLATGWREHDRSRYTIGEDFARRVLRALPPGAHLSATDDNILFVLIYLHFVEKLRPDIDLILQGVGGADLPALRFDPVKDPLYFTHHPNWNLPQLAIVPVGPVFRVWRAEEPPPPAVIESLELAGEADPRVPKDYLTQNLIGHHHFMLGQTFEWRGRWIEARDQYEAATRASPSNDVLFYNLGLIYRRIGLLDEALAMFQRSYEINPRHIASHSSPQAFDRVQEVAAERGKLLDLESRWIAEGAVQNYAPGTPAWHQQMARLLRARNEMVFAQGHELRALEAAAGQRATSPRSLP